MKTLLTLVFVLVFGLTAFASTGTENLDNNLKVEAYGKVTPTQMDIILDSGIIIDSNTNETESVLEKSSARLYKFKNSRIKKALAFRTKTRKPKIA